MQIITKLESALVTYLATWRAVGEPLEGVSVEPAHTAIDQTESSRIVVKASAAAGGLAYAGNYDVTVELIVETNASDNQETALSVHAARVEALRGIFSQGQVSTVTAGINTADATIGSSGFRFEGAEDGRSESSFGTLLRYTFDAYLV